MAEKDEKTVKACSGDDWVEYREKRHCKIHKADFFNGQFCPHYTPPRFPTSNGKQKKGKRASPSEQGVEQGVLQGVTGLTRRDVTIKEQFGASVRSHAFRFVVLLENPKNWSLREQVLKSKGITVIRKGGIGNVGMVRFKGFKLWLSKQKITVYFPNWKQYFVDEAITGYNYAIADLKELLNEFETVLESDFRIGNVYRINVGKQHHAIMQNSLAKQYNREKKKLEVKDMNGELWLLVDNSSVENFRMNELETVHKEKAVDDNVLIKQLFNEFRETGLMPKQILVMFGELSTLLKENAGQIGRVTSNQMVFAENQLSHIKSVQELGAGVREFTGAIRKFNKMAEKKKPSRKEKVKTLLKKHGW